MSNIDPKLKSYRDRAYTLDKEKREIAEAMRNLRKEMKENGGLSKSEVNGVFLWVKQENESEEKKADRNAAQEVADMLALAGAPLFQAAA